MQAHWLALVRTAVGLLQGLALYLLYEAVEGKTWPATDGLVFAPAVLVAAFVPTMVIAGIGNLRARTLVIWTLVAIVVCAGAGFFDISRAPIDEANFARSTRIIPTFAVCAALAVWMFIAHSLVAAGDADRRLVARYTRYFDLAWKHGVQLVLAGAFVAAFWLLLWLGAELFKLIKLEFLADLLWRRWFSIPVTMTGARLCHPRYRRPRQPCDRCAHAQADTAVVAVADDDALCRHLSAGVAVHRPGPALEHTPRHHDPADGCCGALIFLINAAYQDGQPETPVAFVLRSRG